MEISDTTSTADTTITRKLALPDSCQVLVVDDDELTRSYVCSLLQLADYVVCQAGSGREALRKLEVEPCEIVVTDWEMPDINGLDLCRALRSRDADRYTYVLIYSVRSGQGDALQALNAGADDYLIKGPSPAELLARVGVGRRITRLERALRLSGQENRRLSVTDALTSAYNRRFLMKHLPKELERSRRYQRPIAVLSCDLDGFKSINDRFGHEAGDDVLRSFVERASLTLRESVDWIARAGGEEFIVVLPETGLSGASSSAERLRRELSSSPVATCAGPLSVTVSVGATAAQTEQELAKASAIELLRAADQCLYASKSAGRDRVTCASPLCARTLLDPTSYQSHELN